MDHSNDGNKSFENMPDAFNMMSSMGNSSQSNMVHQPRYIQTTSAQSRMPHAGMQQAYHQQTPTRYITQPQQRIIVQQQQQQQQMQQQREEMMDYQMEHQQYQQQTPVSRQSWGMQQQTNLGHGQPDQRPQYRIISQQQQQQHHQQHQQQHQQQQQHHVQQQMHQQLQQQHQQQQQQQQPQHQSPISQTHQQIASSQSMAPPPLPKPQNQMSQSQMAQMQPQMSQPGLVKAHMTVAHPHMSQTQPQASQALMPPPPQASPLSQPKPALEMVDKTKANSLRQQVLRPVAPSIVQRMHHPPTNKPDDKVREMFARLAEYESVFPDSLAEYMMGRAGANASDEVCYRLMAVVGQKVASDILSDAFTSARTRGLGQTNRATKETKYTLTKDLVKEALNEHGMRFFQN